MSYCQKTPSSQRFPLADDLGAGKTIMAGLLIKEMKLRQAVERMLIVAPAPLMLQWQDVLPRFFGEVFQIVNSTDDQAQSMCCSHLAGGHAWHLAANAY